MKPYEIVLRCRLLQPLIDLKHLVESKSNRWSFTRPYYIDERYIWEIYVTEKRKKLAQQQKLKEPSR